MDKVFFIGIIIGVMTRLIMLNLDQKQYPTQPNVLISQLVLAFVASSLGALLVPALIERSYTSITFLSLAGEQFRQVRENRRDTLSELEKKQLVKRGNAFIEEIAKTYEVRNYMCIITSFATVGFYYLITSEFNISQNIGLIISTVVGIVLAFILKRIMRRDSIGDIADVKIVDIEFENESILKVGDLSGITNVGLKKDRDRFLKYGVGIEIIPKDKSYINASIIQNPGQRQTIAYNLYSRLGLYRQKNEPVFTPLPRRNPKNESLVIAYLPIEKDEQAIINVIKSCPIISSAKGKNLALKNYIIGGKEGM
ncbi:YIEGIA family protein [Intestinibacter sp.]|uniref:YIEGIA family protein n=1 Tax=Intestinibacter sp. TaxID=1965304 RepID=UPI003F18DDCA